MTRRTVLLAGLAACIPARTRAPEPLEKFTYFHNGCRLWIWKVDCGEMYVQRQRLGSDEVYRIRVSRAVWDRDMAGAADGVMIPGDHRA